MSGFPDPEWFRAATTIIGERLGTRVGLHARVQFEGRDDERTVGWVQEVVDGRLTRFEPGMLERPDVTISWPLGNALSIMRGELSGNDALAATTIMEDRTHGTYSGPFPPMDLDVQLPEVDALPVVRAATISVQVSCTATMFGTVTCAMQFVDGRLVAVTPEESNPDVTVQMSFRSLLRMRRGEITILDCLDEGGVWGAQGAIINLAGILESAPYQAVQRALAGRSDALATLGDVAPDVRDALRAL